MPVKKILHAHFPLINYCLILGECKSSSWWNLTWKNAQKRITESRLSKWQLTNCEKFAPDLSPERNSLSRLVMEAEQRKKETADWASAVRQVRKRARCTSQWIGESAHTHTHRVPKSAPASAAAPIQVPYAAADATRINLQKSARVYRKVQTPAEW
jgi:hypothetical protein